MVFSLDLSGGPLLGTPARIGYQPVSSAAREGAHTGAAAYQLVNRAPTAANVGRLQIRGAPRADIVTSEIFREEDDEIRPSGVCAAALAAAAAKKFLRENMPQMLSSHQAVR